MAQYHYYLSDDPSAASPPLEDLLTIEADSPRDAAARLVAEGRLPPNWHSLWMHVLVWTSPSGHLRGFESLRLADLPRERADS